MTAHVASSVGWLGAVVCVLAIAAVGLASPDPPTVRGSYVAIELIGWFVLVPLSLASLLTGLVQSLGTKWGLFRHYWVVAKLAINLFATVVLLLYMETLDHLARVATAMPASGRDLDVLRTPSVVLHAGAASVLLLVATVLAVYKPRGLTPYGRRKQHDERPALAR